MGWLWREAERAAAGLGALGVGPDSRVALRMAPGEDLVVGLLAVLWVGASVAIVDRSLSRRAERELAGADAVWIHARGWAPGSTSLRRVRRGDTEPVPLAQACGRIDRAGPTPPGLPSISPGDVVVTDDPESALRAIASGAMVILPHVGMAAARSTTGRVWLADPSRSVADVRDVLGGRDIVDHIGPPVSRPPRPPSVWGYSRAAFVTFLVVFAFVAAVPLPGPINKKKMSDAVAQEELARWVELLGAVGWETDADTLATQVTDWSQGLHSARGSLKAPMRWFTKLTQTQQGWGLFAYPDTHPWAMELHARVDDEWILLYRSGDPEHQFMGEYLAYRRIRALYNPGRKPPGAFKGLWIWLSDRILEAVPEADRARVQFVRMHTTPEGREPFEDGRPRFVRTRVRPQVEP